MPRTLKPSKKVLPTGVDLGAEFTTGITDGHMFPLKRNTMVVLQNTAAAPTTVTLITPATVGGKPIGDQAVAIPANGFQVVGDFDDSFRQGDNTVHVDYAAPATTKIAVLEP